MAMATVERMRRPQAGVYDVGVVAPKQLGGAREALVRALQSEAAAVAAREGALEALRGIVARVEARFLANVSTHPQHPVSWTELNAHCVSLAQRVGDAFAAATFAAEPTRSPAERWKALADAVSAARLCSANIPGWSTRDAAAVANYLHDVHALCDRLLACVSDWAPCVHDKLRVKDMTFDAPVFPHVRTVLVLHAVSASASRVVLWDSASTRTTRRAAFPRLPASKEETWRRNLRQCVSAAGINGIVASALHWNSDVAVLLVRESRAPPSSNASPIRDIADGAHEALLADMRAAGALPVSVHTAAHSSWTTLPSREDAAGTCESPVLGCVGVDVDAADYDIVAGSRDVIETDLARKLGAAAARKSFFDALPTPTEQAWFREGWVHSNTSKLGNPVRELRLVAQRAFRR